LLKSKNLSLEEIASYPLITYDAAFSGAARSIMRLPCAN